MVHALNVTPTKLSLLCAIQYLASPAMKVVTRALPVVIVEYKANEVVPHRKVGAMESWCGHSSGPELWLASVKTFPQSLLNSSPCVHNSQKSQLWEHKWQTHLHKRSSRRNLSTSTHDLSHLPHLQSEPELSELRLRLRKRRWRHSGDRAPWAQASTPATSPTARAPNAITETSKFTP